jgi:gamma-glutamylcyclotransferase (GGCT)/AIG2-like uncharacterized protein YtfP
MNVFVYGTLMRGNSNYYHYLADCEFIGEADLKDYSLFNLGWYPGIKREKNSIVKGEVFKIDQQIKSRLDILEGEGDLYLVNKVDVAINNIGKCAALVYVYNNEVDESSRIPIEKQPWRLEK